MKDPRQLLLLGLAVVMASCQSTKTERESDSHAQASSGSEVVVGKSSRPSSIAISPKAGLDELISVALARHPSLQSTRSRISALEQSAIQAGSLPDPSASIGAGQLAETAAGQVQATLGAQQKIPFPGKLRAQKTVELKKADAMRAQLRADELALAEQVRVAYWNLYSARRTTAVLDESRQTLVTLRESVQARVAANRAKRQDLLRLENEITRLDQRLATAAGREKAAVASLNSLLYRPGSAPLPSPKAGAVEAYPSATTLVNKARTQHPEVASAEARIEAARSGVELANLKKRPDFTAGVSYLPVSNDGLAPSSDGTDQVMGTVGVTIPLWRKKNRAAEKEADALLAAETSNLATVRSSLQQRIGTAHATYDAERNTLNLYSGKLIPDAQQSYDLLVTGYKAETSSFLDVIDAWRQLLNYRIEFEENRGRLGKADAALRRSAGLP